MFVAIVTTVLCLAAAVWWVVSLVRAAAGRGTLGVRREAEDAYRGLTQAFETLRHRYNALDAYSNAYFNSFHAAGWDELRILIDNLELAQSSLLVLMERGKWREVRDISRFLSGDVTPNFAQELMNEYDGLENLANWRRESRDILLRVIQASMDSARKIAAVGISRSRGPKPTLVTLAELRSALSNSDG